MEAGKLGRSSVDVVLAEFNAMRAEKVGHITGQAAVVGLGLTALGVIGGFVAKEGHDRLLLAIPPIAMLVALGSAAGAYRSTVIGRYIRDELWPHLERNLGPYNGPLPSWQHYIAKTHSKWIVVLKVIFLDSPPTVLFVAASGYALYQTADESELLWWLGFVMTSISIAVPLVIGLTIKRNSENAVEKTRATTKQAAAG
jgi:hypothetical protein